MSKPIINIESWKQEKRDAIYLEHRKMVPAIAQNIMRVMPPGTELNDLIQIGEIALLENALKYKDGWGPIEAYLGQRIRWAILREMEGRLARARHEIAISQIGTEDDGQRLLESQAINAEQEESLMADDSVMREAVTSLTGREQQILKLRFIDGWNRSRRARFSVSPARESNRSKPRPRTLGSARRDAKAGGPGIRGSADEYHADPAAGLHLVRNRANNSAFPTPERRNARAPCKVYSISAVTPERRKRAIKRSRGTHRSVKEGLSENAFISDL
jgi:RNA polymerase sigma factor (sigma-70 family)